MFEETKETPESEDYVSPLSADDIVQLAKLMLSNSGQCRGKITGLDAARVFVAHAWLMVKAREQESELSGGASEVQRPYSPVRHVSSLATGVMGSAHMRQVHGVLIRLVGGVTAVRPSPDEPAQPVRGRALTWGGQATRLAQYLQAQAGGQKEPRLRMIELSGMLKVWANTLPIKERDEWLSRPIILRGKKYLPEMEKEGDVIWRFFGQYLLAFGQDLRRYTLHPQWRLPLYTPFNQPPFDAGVPIHRPPLGPGAFGVPRRI